MRRVHFLVAAVVLLSGCAGYYERWADEEVYPILESVQQKVEAARAAETPPGVIEPKEGPEISVSRTEESLEGAEVLTLEDCLALAFSNSRDFKRRKEDLYLSVLSYTSARHQYEWRPSGSMSGNITVSGNGSNETSTSAGGSATLSLARQLLSGGAFTVSTGVSQSGSVSGPGSDSNSSNVSASFSQPLLKGAGTAAREAMVQAERRLTQSVRDFEVFRQDHALSTVRSYYQLVRSKRFLETARNGLDQYTFFYERSRAHFDKGMMSALELLRAKQEMLRAGNNLSDEIEAYNLALDRFKLSLGIETDRNIDIAELEITPVIISVNLTEAIKTAFENRLDFMTQKESLEDSERAVEIARNALLPQLGLSLSANASSDEDLFDYSADNGSVSAGLALTLPLDQRSERNSYRSALISLTQARRSFALAEDNIKLEIRETVRNLRQAEVSLVIQKESVDAAEKRREAAEIEFKQGKVTTRDIVEAQTDLDNAKNALVQAQVDYFLATITLKKNIGTLRVDEKGGWR